MPGSGLSPERFELLVAAAGSDALALAHLAVQSMSSGDGDRARTLARRALALDGGNGEVASLAASVLSSGVPEWHFTIIRDQRRNDAYERALQRAVTPDSKVLDIGSGTGLLAMLAARAGAREVITCEKNPAVASAAAEIVARNGFAGRIRVVSKSSLELDVDADLGGPADVLVSEIVSRNALAQGMIPTLTDAMRLLKPAARIIPSRVIARVALAEDREQWRRRAGQAAGFDLTPFNALANPAYKIPAESDRVVRRSEAAALFDFDLYEAASVKPARSAVSLVSEGGTVNGIVQWLELHLDDEIRYENTPGQGTPSCWAVNFFPLARPVAIGPGEAVAVHGRHDGSSMRIWAGNGAAGED